MSLKVGIINWWQAEDYAILEWLTSILNSWIIEWFEIKKIWNPEENKWVITKWKALIEVERISWDKFCLPVYNNTPFEIDLSWNKKIWLEIDKQKVITGENIWADNSNVASIKSWADYPSENFYLALWEITDWNIVNSWKKVEVRENLWLTKMWNNFNSENKLVKLDEEWKLPAVNWANLTGISAWITWEIRIWSTNTAPTGWLICNWSAVSRAQYADLFSVIWTSFWVWNWSSTFNLPNLKGKVVAWVDSSDWNFNTVWKIGWSKTNSHTHGYNIPSHGYNYNGWSWSAWAQAVFENSWRWSNIWRQSWNRNLTSASTNISLLQPYMALNYIIKI